MEGVEPVMAKGGREEAGERGYQPGIDTMQGEGLEGTAQGFRLGRADLEHLFSPLVVTALCQSERGGEVLILGNGGRAQGWLEPRSRARSQGRRFCLVGGHRS